MGIFDSDSGGPATPDTIDSPEVTDTTESPIPRFDLPEVDTSINQPTSANEAVKADVMELAPPEDIDAAQIGEYTPYQAVMGSVTPDATVEGRLSGLLSQNNPYIDRARTEAAQLANRRGMLNTSMAAGAAEGAAIDRALPIAQQDAKAFLEQQFLNQGYSNEAAKHLADASIQRENTQAAFEQDTRQFNAARRFEANKLQFEAENQASMQFANEQNKNNFAVLSADLQAQLKGIDNELAINLETLTREYGLLENLDTINGDIYKQMIAEMGSILAQPDTKVGTANAKLNALIKASGVNLSFSNSMTGGTSAGPGGGGTNEGNAAGNFNTINRPPRPSEYHTWNESLWRWEDSRNNTRDDRCCFTGDTLVTMQDGSTKQIADIEIGDIVLGMDDEKNVVTGIEVPPLGQRSVYAFNGGKPFVTREHPFMTSKGWKSLNPASTKAEGHDVVTGLLLVGDHIHQEGEVLFPVESIDKHRFDPETPVYNLMLSGNHTYYAKGLLVHNKQGDGPGGGGGGGDGAGSKIICTALNDMYGFGSFRNRIWLEYDDKIGRHKRNAEYLELGYHKLFMPLAKAMPKHPLLAKILRRIVTVRSMRCRNELRGKPCTFEQKLYQRLFETPCVIAGWLIKRGILERVNVRR